MHFYDPSTVLELLVCVGVTGLERPPEAEALEGKLPDHFASRRDSTSSLDSTVSSGVQISQMDHPEQYEVIKQQKEIIEHGIEL